MLTPSQLRRLTFIERLLAKMTEAMRRLEGERDSLLREQTDLEGAHDRRKVAVR